MTEKYKLQQEDINSMDLTSDTLAKLKQILPEVFTEGADGKLSVDMEKLKIALGGAVDVGADNQTRFSFGWSGKKQAQALANQPSTATLRPSIEDSKNWDNTQNVYIEGDNLEVLKLLQKSYYGQIKMIYIDPPYNTGKDFVYKDNFHDNVKNYLQLTGQVDDEGNKISTNTDKSGRYHTDWLNMMYPRLKLARNLLKDDGVIFISIDDNEVHNLRKICDEIFGEDNFVSLFTLLCNPKGRAQDKYFATNHEYVIAYSKSVLSKGSFNILKSVDQIAEEYKEEDYLGLFRALELRNTHREFGKHNRPNLFYPFYVETDAEKIFLEPTENTIEVLPIWDDGFEGCWTWGRPKAVDELDLLTPKKIGSKWKVYVKDYADNSSKMLKTILIDKAFYTEKGQKTFNNLLGTKDKIFQSPKSHDLLIQLLKTCTNDSDIILDFFSGSATTAHSVMQLNAEDGGTRKYICVQLPETTSTDSEAYKAGYKNICEIGKERIRRAGEKIFAEWTEKHDRHAALDAVSTDLLNEGVDSMSGHGMTRQNEHGMTAPDIGFKVFRLDTSNIKPFDANDMFADDLLVADRSALDLFYELVLKQGYSLDNRQCVLDIGGTGCYALVHEDNTPFVLAVLDDTVKPNFALELIKYALTLVIVKDACFGTDEIKLNLLATLEQLQNKDNPLQIRIV